MVAELVRLKVDVIVTQGTPAVLAAPNRTARARVKGSRSITMGDRFLVAMSKDRNRSRDDSGPPPHRARSCPCERTHVRLRMSQLAHGRSTFAMIAANCVAGRDRGKGLPVLSARQFIGAATTALSLITGAFLLALAAGNARAQGSAPACDAAGEIALLPSPWAPWKGAPLRVMLVTEKPLQGELSLTGPRDQGAPGQTGRAGLRGGEHLALAQHLESRKREPVLRLDREAVRRSARCGAVVAGVARGGARPLAQFPVQPSRPQRRR